MRASLFRTRHGVTYVCWNNHAVLPVYARTGELLTHIAVWLGASHDRLKQRLDTATIILDDCQFEFALRDCGIVQMLVVVARRVDGGVACDRNVPFTDALAKLSRQYQFLIQCRPEPDRCTRIQVSPWVDFEARVHDLITMMEGIEAAFPDLQWDISVVPGPLDGPRQSFENAYILRDWNAAYGLGWKPEAVVNLYWQDPRHITPTIVWVEENITRPTHRIVGGFWLCAKESDAIHLLMFASGEIV